MAAVAKGDLGRAEAILVAHAHTLDEIFSALARRSAANIEAGYGESADRYMRLALKAQSQCRTTLEALAEIKDPRPVAFVRQANIAAGPQQVNNAFSLPDSRAGNSQNEPIKLLEDSDGERLDLWSGECGKRS